MKALRLLFLFWIGTLFTATGAGCGKKHAAAVDPEAVPKAKVNAMKKLAEAMAKEPDGIEAKGALEEFRIHPIDFQKNPTEASEILEIYRQQIQGKYRGEVAQEIHTEMLGYLAASKDSKK